MPIPKKIHISWKNKDILNSNSFLIENGIKNLIKLNNDWEIEISDDTDVDNYLIDNMKDDYTLVKNIAIVPKTDIWRLYKIYNEGGIYVDIDRFCDVNLNKIIPEDVSVILPVCRNYDFAQDLMISEPKNVLFKNAIEMYLHRKRLGYNHIYFLGAQTYMHAITYTFFGKMIDTNPGESVFKNIIDEISNTKDILIFEENPPYFTFLYRSNKIQKDWVLAKKEFYKEQNVKHWTDEW